MYYAKILRLTIVNNELRNIKKILKSLKNQQVWFQTTDLYKKLLKTLVLFRPSILHF